MNVGGRIGGRQDAGPWADTFDDGVRACLVALIDLHREPPSHLTRRERRRLRKHAWPLVFRALNMAQVDGFADDPRPWLFDTREGKS